MTHLNYNCKKCMQVFLAYMLESGKSSLLLAWHLAAYSGGSLVQKLPEWCENKLSL
jgi:hypothetical protein